MTRAAPTTTAQLGVNFSVGVNSSTLLALAARAPGRDEVLANLVGWR
jgi:hypothetical protein